VEWRGRRIPTLIESSVRDGEWQPKETRLVPRTHAREQTADRLSTQKSHSYKQVGIAAHLSAPSGKRLFNYLRSTCHCSRVAFRDGEPR